MNSCKLSSFFRQLVLKGLPQARTHIAHQCHLKGFSTLVSSARYRQAVCQSQATAQLNIIQSRFKRASRNQSNKQSTEDNEDEEDDDEDEELANENPLLVDDILGGSSDGSQHLTINVSSLRLDAFAKTAFALTRAKVEEAFYKGDLYVNGEKAQKKSLDLSLDDEIDIVRQVNVEDRNKLDIRRVQIVSLPDKASEQGRMKVAIRRWMDLTVDAYDKQDE